MPPQMPSTPLPEKEFENKNALYQNQYEAHEYLEGDMDKSAAYVAYGDAATSLMEDANVENRSEFAANIILGPNALARDMAYEVLMNVGKAEDLAYVISHTDKASILQGLSKVLLSRQDLTIRDLALAIDVVPEIKGVRSAEVNKDLRQKIFEELCKKGREIDSEAFIQNVAVALALPSRYAVSSYKGFMEYGESEFEKSIIMYLGANARFVLGENSKFALEIELSTKKEKLAKIEKMLVAIKEQDAPENLVKEFEKFIEDIKVGIAGIKSRVK